MDQLVIGVLSHHGLLREQWLQSNSNVLSQYVLLGNSGCNQVAKTCISQMNTEQLPEPIHHFCWQNEEEDDG